MQLHELTLYVRENCWKSKGVGPELHKLESSHWLLTKRVLDFNQGQHQRNVFFPSVGCPLQKLKYFTPTKLNKVLEWQSFCEKVCVLWRKKKFYKSNNICNNIFIRKILWAWSVWTKAQHHFWSSQQNTQCLDLDKALQPSKDLLEKSGFLNQAGMAKLISDRILPGSFFFFFLKYLNVMMSWLPKQIPDVRHPSVGKGSGGAVL